VPKVIACDRAPDRYIYKLLTIESSKGTISPLKRTQAMPSKIEHSEAKRQLSTLGTFPPEADQPLAEAHFKL